MIELRSTPEDAGTRIDLFLADTLGSRSRAQRLLDLRAVRVDESTVAKSFRLTGEGERVTVDVDADAPEAAAPDRSSAPADFAIAYEDDDLLVVDKPAGVVVHPARGHREGTLAQALEGRAAGGEDPYRAGIVHRLDRDTSGLLVVAKSDEVHRLLKEALQARELRREYLALVDGRPPARTGTIDAPIGRDRKVRTRQSTDTDDPREARTHFALEEAYPHATLLRVTLETGRTHQIRVHLQAIGHCVLGDPEYGPTASRWADLPLTRQWLHATRLAFAHPITGADVDVTSPVSADLAAAREQVAVT